MRVVDLFSGAGGMSAGFQQAGFEIVGAVDAQVTKNGRGSEYVCNQTYEANIGVRPLTADLARVDAAVLRRNLGLGRSELDVLIACPPCTGFSQKRAKSDRRDTPQNRLVPRIADIVLELRPKVLIIENVPPAFEGPYRHHLRKLFGALEDGGYQLRTAVEDLALLGVPQRRVRMLVVALRGRRNEASLPPELQGKTRVRVRTVRDAIIHLPRLAAGQVCATDPMHTCLAHGGEVMARIRAIPKNGGSWRAAPASLFPKSLRASDGYYDMYGRMAWDEPAPTITRECSHPGMGRYLHPTANRMISVREMALLQGFPPEFQFAGGIVMKYAQIGNAVPPIAASKIAKHVRALLDTR
jgi:DNA (cytosine-5)-methyltransferase 1